MKLGCRIHARHAENLPHATPIIGACFKHNGVTVNIDEAKSVLEKVVTPIKEDLQRPTRKQIATPHKQTATPRKVRQTTSLQSTAEAFADDKYDANDR